MNFCSHCGAKTELAIPDGDDRQRHICSECDTIHYLNPKIITGCLPFYGDKVLLCKRAIEPRHGLWTLPAGFMENSESVEQGAARESWEEARIKVADLSLYQVFSLPQINQVYFFFLAAMAKPEFAPGPESLEVALYGLDEIPWEQLAFPVVETTLRHFIADRPTGQFPVRSQVMERRVHPKGQ